MSRVPVPGATPGWRVLLVGGSSGTGKTFVAARLASRFGTMCSMADDFRLVLQRVTRREEHGALHFFTTTPDVWQMPAEELCERLVDVAAVVSSGLEIVVAHHAAAQVPIVLEGDGILPSLAVRRTYAGYEAEEGQVRAVFIYEAEERAIFRSMLGRGRGYEMLSAGEQATAARTSWLYGRWLRDRAVELGLPVVESRPRATLVRRVAAAVR